MKLHCSKTGHSSSLELSTLRSAVHKLDKIANTGLIRYHSHGNAHQSESLVVPAELGVDSILAALAVANLAAALGVAASLAGPSVAVLVGRLVAAA